MRVVAISDTHRKHDMLNLPKGDALLVAGDVTSHGEIDQLEDFAKWFGKQKYKHKIMIAGNHDFCFQNELKYDAKLALSENNIIYLEDSSVVVNGIKIYGSPWQPWFYNWAFNLNRGAEIIEKWNLIDRDTDILITHGPAFNILDETKSKEHVGCADLCRYIEQIKPAVHISGHIHEAYGEKKVGDTHYMNASVLNIYYNLQNPAIVFDIDKITKKITLIKE